MPRAATAKRAKSGAASTTTTISFDASCSAPFAFAPNITPGSYNDPQPSFESVFDSSLFPSCDVPPRKVTHSRKKPEDHVPRPPNAFILFRSSFVKSDHVSASKQIWFDKAKALLEAHKQKYPGYSFRPSSKHSTPYPRTKRKVREVGPKDTKRCEKIAELLVKGKKGAELDEAVNEFDCNHVPEIVTRFDAPVTARHFRRSSSAPADERPTRPSSIRFRHLRTSSARSLVDAQHAGLRHAFPDGRYESMSEYSAPSSPFAETSHEYAMPAPNPDMGFESFSFNACAAPSPVDSCDPLSSPAYAEQQLDIFAPQPQVAYTMQQLDFHPSDGLRIDTNVAGDWAGPSSTPMSSSPCTPSPYPSEYMPAEPTYYGGQVAVAGQLDELQGLPVEMFQNDAVQEQWIQPTEGYYYAPMYAPAADHSAVYQKYADIPDAVYHQEHLFAVPHSYPVHHQ
ncbi:uncharacterized protein B0H18DRAFT_1115639 [Fomitopsis serialis]|uniref:uncharacterized protein n=1 Tax=Fomitopsis serialis TaxID=139415 RepID=UPI0020087F86|nr:uncharacterized protein B0H18DRAFT_1115639 [Neoantrodia serialis]KAH9933002.1 hypothetical protein B0H18DRAFT_1115639 [Neoantrodia serialis]